MPEITIPKQFTELFNPYWLNIIFYGGRSGTKSTTFGEAVLEKMRQNKIRVLCGREIQLTIADSVHHLLEKLIEKNKYAGFKVTKTYIMNYKTGSITIYSGMNKNSRNIQSLDDIDISWMEEAQALSKDSLKFLLPTIRKDNCQRWFSMNRFMDNDPVWEKLCKNPSKRTYIKKVNLDDLHPHFQNKTSLEDQAEDKKNNYNEYLHIWQGEPLGQHANSTIERVKIIQAMERSIEAPEGGIVVGADIARFGDDLITFYKRKGLKIIDQKTYSKQSITKTANDLMVFAEHKKLPINIDDTGVGGGVTDILTDKGYNAIGINFGGKDQLTEEERDKYENNITKMWIEFAGIIDQVDIPNDEDLKTELSTRLYAYTKDQKKVIEPKKDFKKRYGKSPDKADGLLLCFTNTIRVDLPQSRLLG